MRFTPLQDFHDADLRSSYEVGLNYQVRAGNAALAEKVQRWLVEGKVRLGAVTDAGPAEAKVRGAGFVK